VVKVGRMDFEPTDMKSCPACGWPGKPPSPEGRRQRMNAANEIAVQAFSTAARFYEKPPGNRRGAVPDMGARR